MSIFLVRENLRTEILSGQFLFPLVPLITRTSVVTLYLHELILLQVLWMVLVMTVFFLVIMVWVVVALE